MTVFTDINQYETNACTVKPRLTFMHVQYSICVCALKTAMAKTVPCETLELIAPHKIAQVFFNVHYSK